MRKPTRLRRHLLPSRSEIAIHLGQTHQPRPLLITPVFVPSSGFVLPFAVITLGYVFMKTVHEFNVVIGQEFIGIQRIRI